MKAAKPRRRWFRFTLRIFFVVLTLFGVWLGVQVKWKQDRRDARTWISARGHYLEWSNDPTENGPFCAPLNIRLLGERGVGRIYVENPHGAQEHQLLELKRLFPEAEVLVRNPVSWENVPAYRRIPSDPAVPFVNDPKNAPIRRKIEQLLTNEYAYIAWVGPKHLSYARHIQSVLIGMGPRTNRQKRGLTREEHARLHDLLHQLPEKPVFGIE